MHENGNREIIACVHLQQVFSRWMWVVSRATLRDWRFSRLLPGAEGCLGRLNARRGPVHGLWWRRRTVIARRPSRWE